MLRQNLNKVVVRISLPFWTNSLASAAPANGKLENLSPYCMDSAESSAESAISVKESICLCKLTLTEVCWKNSILKVVKEIPESLTRIHSNRTYNDKLINHPLFQRYQIWYLGKTVSGSPCRCSGFLCPQCIQENNLPLYVQGLLLLKEQRVLDTKTHILFLCSSFERYFKFVQ